jgi:hypothetical protein
LTRKNKRKSTAEKLDYAVGAFLADLLRGYSLFMNYMEALAQGGLTAEVIPGSASKKGDDKSISAAQGRYCFDVTKSVGRDPPYPRCGSCVEGVKLKQEPLFTTVPGVGRVMLGLVVRSPVAVYRYLGSQLQHNREMWDGYETDEAKNVLPFGTEPFLNVAGGRAICFTSFTVEGEVYCVPSSSRHTALIFNILQELKNLSTNPKDLNAAFRFDLLETEPRGVHGFIKSERIPDFGRI